MSRFHRLWNHHGVWLVFCLGIGVIASVLSRTDANWDLQNYHLYGPFAALTGRLGQDYFVAGFQGYFNPLADIPYFVARFYVFPNHPRLVAAFAGLPYGALIFLTGLIASQLTDATNPRKKLNTLLAIAIGVTGATTVSEIGTTYNDILLADFILAGLAWYFSFWGENFKAAAGMGLAFGMAAALKLTAMLFLPAALPFLLLSTRQRSAFFLSLFIFGAAAAIGFVVCYGWWGWQLWQHFGSPFFPLFGNVLPSPLAKPMNAADARFFPRDIWQWIFYPFFWLQGKAFIVSEEKLRDPRFALVYLALCFGIIRHWCRSNPIRRPVIAFWAFFVTAYLTWLLGFSILRYAVPLEALSGIVIFTVLAENLSLRHTQYALLAVFLFCLIFTKPMGWGRIGYDKTLVQNPVPELPQSALVFISGGPLGYLLPFLASPDSHFISLSAAARNAAETAIVKGLLANGAPSFLLSNHSDLADGLAVSAFGLQADAFLCRKINSAVQKNIQICPLQRIK